jgi:hypothetical protein
MLTTFLLSLGLDKDISPSANAEQCRINSFGGLLLHGGKDMCIGIERDADIRVAQAFRDDPFDVGDLFPTQCRVRMLRIVGVFVIDNAVAAIEDGAHGGTRRGHRVQSSRRG